MPSMPARGEALLAGGQQRRAARRWCAGRSPSMRAGDRADVRQLGAARRQRAAAEVEAVELHLARGVGQRERGDQRAQQRCSCRSAARRRRPRARRAGQVEHQRVAALLAAAVDDADVGPQGARAGPGCPRSGRGPGRRPAEAAAGPASAAPPAAAATPGGPGCPAPSSRSTRTSSRLSPSVSASVGSGRSASSSSARRPPGPALRRWTRRPAPSGPRRGRTSAAAGRAGGRCPRRRPRGTAPAGRCRT